MIFARSEDTGFPKKDARFLKIENIPDQLSDHKEGKIIQTINYNILAIGRLLWETLYLPHLSASKDRRA